MSSNAAEAADVIALLRQDGLLEGGILYARSREAFPTAEIRGVELSPLPYWVARLRTQKMPNMSIRWGDFYKRDLSDADAVTCYLSQPFSRARAFGAPCSIAGRRPTRNRGADPDLSAGLRLPATASRVRKAVVLPGTGAHVSKMIGRGDKIRICNPLHPMQVR